MTDRAKSKTVRSSFLIAINLLIPLYPGAIPRANSQSTQSRPVDRGRLIALSSVMPITKDIASLGGKAKAANRASLLDLPALDREMLNRSVSLVRKAKDDKGQGEALSKYISLRKGLPDPPAKADTIGILDSLREIKSLSPEMLE